MEESESIEQDQILLWQNELYFVAPSQVVPSHTIVTHVQREKGFLINFIFVAAYDLNTRPKPFKWPINFTLHVHTNF